MTMEGKSDESVDADINLCLSGETRFKYLDVIPTKRRVPKNPLELAKDRHRSPTSRAKKSGTA